MIFALLAVVLAAAALASVIVTVGSGDAGVGDLLLLALWVTALLTFAAGCLARVRRGGPGGRSDGNRPQDGG